MALGIEQNSIAPQLIANSGAALSQIIRQTGQQVQGHIAEIQTRRDLGAMAQEIQGLNPQTDEFPVQLVQLASRHPMALNDQRGQLAVQVLGKAHGDWRRGIEAVEAFNRDRAMLGYRERAMRERAAEAAARDAKTTKVGRSIVDLSDPENPRTVFSDPLQTTGTVSPRVLSPGAVLVDPTGKKLAENPMSAKSASVKDKTSLLLRRDKDLQTEIAGAIKRLDDIQKRDLEIEKETPEKAFLRNTAQAIQKEVEELRKRRTELQRSIEQVEASAAPAAGDGLLPVPDNALILAGQVPAAPVTNEFVLVLDPSGRPGKVKASQLEAALQNGYKRR